MLGLPMVTVGGLKDFLRNIGPQCVQNRRSVASSSEQSNRGVRDCTFDKIQTCLTVTYRLTKVVYIYRGKPFSLQMVSKASRMGNSVGD